MRKIYLILLLFTISGCSAPQFSILNLSDTEIYDHSINIDGDTYYITTIYTLDELNERVKDSLISSYEIVLSNESSYDCYYINLSKDSIFCFSENEKLIFNMAEVNEIILNRRRTKGDIENGLGQMVIWPLTGYSLSLLNENSKSYVGVIIGAGIGLAIFLYEVLDDNRFYERIYIKK